jgi:membrane protein involved in D-alanine export
MIPFAGFAYFGILLYVALPTLVLGAFRRAGRHWALFATLAFIVVQYWTPVRVHPKWLVHAFWFVIAWALYQAIIARSLLLPRARGSSRIAFYSAVGASLLPLFLAKAVPLFSTSQFGFLGISYVTFRALDLIFCIQDRVVTSFALPEYFGFLLFFPTISSGPIDRFRRFRTDWHKTRTRAEFLDDLGEGMHRIFRGFLYKFILAYVIERYWMNPAANRPGLLGTVGYMYAYTFYLFFDFAGYSAFAIGLGYLFGIHTPENFDRPFLARNIRDFWNRWHISLSFWFRDHVYMRFVFAAMRGKWFKDKHTAAILAYYLSFGLMGLWHGIAPHYILYGLYHGTLLSGYDIFSRWNKKRQLWKSGPLWSAASVLLTFHAFAFGLLLFSGHLTSSSTSTVPAMAAMSGKTHTRGVLETVSPTVISGWAWDEKNPNTPVQIVIMENKHLIGTLLADQFRQDLANEGRGNGRHGFTFTPPPALRDGNRHLVTVLTGRKPLAGSPWSLNPDN